MFSNPITAAIRARRLDPCPPLQIGNRRPGDMMPTPDPAAADAVKAAWLPLLSGQEIPLLGEVRYVVPDCE